MTKAILIFSSYFSDPVWISNDPQNEKTTLIRAPIKLISRARLPETKGGLNLCKIFFEKMIKIIVIGKWIKIFLIFPLLTTFCNIFYHLYER